MLAEGEPERDERPDEDKSYAELLKSRMTEQFQEGKRLSLDEKPPIGDSSTKKSLSQDEIEEMRKKREKFKKEKEKEKEDGEIKDGDKSRKRRSDEKEEGEVGSDDEREKKRRRNEREERDRRRDKERVTTRRSRSRDRSFRRSRSRDRFAARRFSPPPSHRDGFRRGGYDDRRGRSRSRSPGFRDNRDRGRRDRSRERGGGGGGGGRRDDFRGSSSRAAIDKEKLLAIARKNAVKLLSSDNLMGIDHNRLLAIKSGGQSLGQLTSFCRELARKGITDEFSEDEDSQRPHNSDDEDDEASGIHHPFKVTDRPIPLPFSLSGRAGSSLAPSGAALEYLNPTAKAAAKTHRMLEFPVSSGNAHRVKEVEIPKAITHVPGAVVPKEEASKKVEEEEVKKEEEEEEEEEGEVVPRMPSAAAIANACNPLGVLMFGGHKEEESVKEAEEKKKKKEEEEKKKEEEEAKKKEAENKEKENKEKEEKNTASGTTTTTATALTSSAMPPPAAPPTPTPSTSATPTPTPTPSTSSGKVFDVVEGPDKDIGSIVSQRLAAMRRLNHNPTDPEALKEMYHAQKQMSTWAASKNTPGQFTGHTGAKILSKGELSLGVQAWARQEQFSQAKKVSGGFGEYLLKKMGWSEGEGLGKERNGEIDPLTLDIKMDKKGLISAEEQLWKKGGRRGGGGPMGFSGPSEVKTLTAMKDLSGKHPVSALMELSTKRKWGAPSFTQAFECGPPHKKQYVFRVTVNGKDYQPSVACDNKKKAKTDSATFCLQELGLLPKDPNNPL